MTVSSAAKLQINSHWGEKLVQVISAASCGVLWCSAVFCVFQAYRNYENTKEEDPRKRRSSSANRPQLRWSGTPGTEWLSGVHTPQWQSPWRYWVTVTDSCSDIWLHELRVVSCYVRCVDIYATLLYIGWQWRNIVPYLCQLIFATILWVKLW